MTFDKDYQKWDNLQSNVAYFRNKAFEAKTQKERLDAVYNAQQSQRMAEEQFNLMMREYPL